MLLQPRQYQIEAVQSVYDYFTVKDGNPIVAMPTGTGKSVVIAMFLERAFRDCPQQKVLVITHVKELIVQNYKKLIALWPTAPAGIYSSGLNRRDVLQKILFCGIASIAKRAAEFGHVDLIIIDEAHLVSPTEDTMYRMLINALRAINPMLKVIGLTATKYRLGHGDITKGEDGLFTDTCFDITSMNAFNRLIAEGYLAPLVAKKTTTVLDIDGVHMRGGEFIQGELQAAVNRDDITIKALREAMETCGDRKHWLIFCSGVEHAIRTAEIAEMLGISCRSVHSKMPAGERDKNIAEFQKGQFTALTNNNVLTTGFDYPEIDLIICLRPTASSVLWVQMLGRGTRPVYAPGFDLNSLEGRMQAIMLGGKRDCMVMDFAANTKKLGPINDPVIPRRKGEGGGEAPVKVCPICDSYMHASVRKCTGTKKDGTQCTHEFTFELKLKQEASTDEVIKGDLPIVERFPISNVVFSKHVKMGKPDAMRVSYYCGLQKFEEYVCVEHGGFAGKKARDWMRARMPDPSLPIPETTIRALEYAENFKVPKSVAVWINKKYPEIMSFDWSENTVTVTVDREAPVRNFTSFNTLKETVDAFEDDDIPF